MARQTRSAHRAQRPIRRNIASGSSTKGNTAKLTSLVDKSSDESSHSGSDSERGEGTSFIKDSEEELLDSDDDGPDTARISQWVDEDNLDANIHGPQDSREDYEETISGLSGMVRSSNS